MRRILIGLLASIGAFVVLVFVLGFVAALLQPTPAVPSNTILELELAGPLLEELPQDPFAQLALRDQASVRDLVDALDRAAADARVTSLIAKLSDPPLGLAHVQELRDAVLRFRASGKRAVAFSESFGGDWGAGNGSYYLATAFERIYLQPSGNVALTGLRLESPFVRKALDELEIEPQGDHRREYKNALNLFTEREFTPAHREASQALLDSWSGQLVRGIAQARGLTEAEVRGLIDRGPFLPAEAVASRLVDELAYRDEVYEREREEAGEGAELLYLRPYLARAGRPHQEGTAVALIHGAGAVVQGRSQYDPLFGSAVMGADSVTAALRAAIDDADVKAILFRVDSPGGSYIASDAIWRETVRAREAGKRVVVSMSNVAASGGYFVAMAAHRIVAHPGTVTGSIGVVAWKPVVTRFLDDLGLTFDAVEAGENASIYSLNTRYSDAEWARLQAWLDHVYGDFTAKVASGRGLERAQVLELAKGRIWTGEAALEHGLVDALGGYATALALVRQELALEADAPLQLIPFPRPRTPIELLVERMQGGGPDSSESVAARLVQRLAPVQRWLARTGLSPARGVLTAPVPVLER